jgi:hypothetical protein
MKMCEEINQEESKSKVLIQQGILASQYLSKD